MLIPQFPRNAISWTPGVDETFKLRQRPLAQLRRNLKSCLKNSAFCHVAQVAHVAQRVFRNEIRALNFRFTLKTPTARQCPSVADFAL
jgi:hypothetical protein